VKVTLGRLDMEMAGSPGGRMGPVPDRDSQEFDALDGVEVSDLDAQSRRELNVPQSVRGALVTSVSPDSNSAEGGLRPGDIILEIDRKPVRNADEAVKASRDLRGDLVTLRVFRDGTSLYLTVDNTRK
jgi:serine protease Do